MFHLVFSLILIVGLVEALVWLTKVTLKVTCLLVLSAAPLAHFLGLFEPPPFDLEMEDLPPGLDQDGVQSGASTHRMRLEGEGPASLSGSAWADSRLRARSRWVRHLEGLLGGRHGVVGLVVRGRWVPDLPSTRRSPVANALLSNLRGGAKLLGGGVVERTGGETPGSVVYYHLELPEGESVLVFPDLLSRLQSYAVFRPRDSALVGALRARAREWCKLEVPAWVWPLAIPSAVALAMRTSVSEEQGVRMIEAEGNSALLSGRVL